MQEVSNPTMSAQWKKIVVAYDGSTCSRAALATAMSLAKAESATLLVCTVVDPIAIATEHAPMPPTQAALDEGRALARRLAQEATETALKAGATSQALTAEGEPAYEIVQTARQNGADAIVIGTHGRSGIKRAFLGSVAEETLRSSSIPVVVVRDAKP